MPSPLDTLELVPGESLGPFQLGRSVYETLPLLRNNHHTPAEVSWAQAAPTSEPILIHVLKPDVRLLFSTTQAQRMIAIELSNPSPWLHYQSHKWQVREGASAEKTLLRLFGPTYQPSSSPHHPDLDFLCYPGVAFGLKNEGKSSPGDNLEKLIITPTSSETESEDPTVNFTKISDLFNGILDIQLPPKLNGFDQASITIGRDGKKTSVAFSKHSMPEPITVTLGVTHAEDLLCDFGQPQHVYFKDDDRLAIHRHLARSPSPRSPSASSAGQDKDHPYFFNYFELGVDFLVSGTSNLLLKVILHSNTPGEVLFGRYEHCKWTLGLKDADSTAVSSADSATAVVQFLAQSNTSLDSNTPTDKPRPKGRNRDHVPASTPTPGTLQESFKLDRTADLPDDQLIGKETDLLGFPGVVLERTDCDTVETLWVFEPASA